MRDLSLHILDLAQNSVRANAALVEIMVSVDESRLITITIRDDGSGMSDELKERVTSPFATTRTTRKVGLGVPFFKMAAEMTGGSFAIDSRPGEGTAVRAVFGLRHIDRMPMGDLAASFCTLLQPNPEVDFVLTYAVDDHGFTIDTREYRAVLEGLSLGEPEVLAFIAEQIREGMRECGGGV